MKLSAPIYRLKRQAKKLSRSENIPLHEALDRVAAKEGFARWSLLAADFSATAPASVLFTRLGHGDMLLIGARPGHGKTHLSLELAVEAMKSGRQSVFFTLEYSVNDILALFDSIGQDPATFRGEFEFDDSDKINADYIKRKLSTKPAGTVVVVDYLQLLDHKRENPTLSAQIRSLKLFALKRGLVMVFISQIDRSFISSAAGCPGLNDVRLPNPLDLNLFNKTCFLNEGELQVSANK